MSSTTHKALYVDQDCQFSVRSDLGPYKNGDGEVLIETLFSGINPGDILHSTHLGMKSMVMGYDYCGRVLSAPPNSQFKQDDIVAGCTVPRDNKPAKYGAHQSTLVSLEDMVWKVPSSMPHSHAAALTIVVMTAADALYNHFGKPMPSNNPSTDDKTPMLIWGASSSVGICAVQLARASGVQNILVTASPARHDLLRSLGATQCFDYKSPTVASDIRAAVEALGQGPLGHVFDAAGGIGTSPTPAELAARCAPDPSTSFASVVFPEDKRFKMVYALPKHEFAMRFPGSSEPIVTAVRPADHWKAWDALLWAIGNYGTAFKLPDVDVVAGTAEEAMEALHQVAEKGRGFGKTVIQHPME